MGHLYWGQVWSSCSRDQQRRQHSRVGQGGGPDGFLGTTGRVSSRFPSICVALLILTWRTWVGEDGRVSYKLIRWFSSRDEKGGGDNDGEGRERGFWFLQGFGG